MLYLVTTPIGNLSDITMRALDTLRSVQLILCEDTRHSAVLLSYYGITTPTRVYERFSEARQQDAIVGMLREGKDIALISDAGTPIISDPGEILIKRLKSEGLAYTLVGSGCAAVSALVLSGMDASSFCYVGFLPEKDIDRRRKLDKFSALESTLIFYVSPHNIKKDVELLGEVLGSRNACLVREISKLYEDKIDFCLPTLPENATLKGEMVLIVQGAPPKSQSYLSLTIPQHVEMYLQSGLDEKSALKATARDRSLSKSEIYKAYKTTAVIKKSSAISH